MELSWIEDFLSVAETGNFTRSAQIRHLTQPSLSRRIRALEQWLGTDLIDRSSYPTRLTPAGKLFREQAIVILEQLNAARALMRRHPVGQQPVRFALPHTLALSFFPSWLARIQSSFGVFPSRMSAGNVHDAVLSLVEGNSDLLICYHHAAQPVDLDATRYPFLRLGSETVRPYARPGHDGSPQYSLEDAGTPVPFLHYAPEASLRRVVDRVLEQVPSKAPLLVMYETAMAESLKNMALEGHGVAFLPDSTVAREAQEGKLVLAGDRRWSADMEIRVYRDSRREHPPSEALWEHLGTM